MNEWKKLIVNKKNNNYYDNYYGYTKIQYACWNLLI